MTAAKRPPRGIPVSPIHSTADLDHALAEISELMDLKKPTREQRDRLEVLSILAWSYEQQHVSEQRKALLPILGSKSRVSAVLRGARKLSPEMIVTLHEELGIPLESLISDVANRAGPSRVRKAK